LTIPDPCLRNLQETDYTGLKKSGESVEAETICTTPDPYSQIQIILSLAFQMADLL